MRYQGRALATLRRESAINLALGIFAGVLIGTCVALIAGELAFLHRFTP